MSGEGLGIALLGCCHAGRTLHAPLVRSTSGLDLRTIVTSRPEAVRADIPEATTCAEADEVLRDPAILFQNRRWDSDFLGLRAVLDERAIGTPTHLESRFDRFPPEVTGR